MRPCGCPSIGVQAVDERRHADFHLRAEAQGIPPGPVTLATVRAARGITAPAIRPADFARREAIVSGRRPAPARPIPVGSVPVADRDDAHDRQAAVDSPRADVGLDHPVESHKAAAGALRRSGSLRAQVLALVAIRGEAGATSDEIERHLDRAHQSISATLYGLEKDGLAARSGPVRATQYANDARAYTITPWGWSELRRVGQARPGDW